MKFRTAVILSISIGTGTILARTILNVWFRQSLVEDLPTTLLISAVSMCTPFLIYLVLYLLDSIDG
jgi:hypothetical protein